MTEVELNMREASQSLSGRVLLKSLSTAALLLLVPGFELLFLRLFLKFGLELKIGFFRTTDFDYFFSVPTAVFLLVFSLEHARPLVLSFQKKRLGWNLAFVSLFLGLNYYLSLNPPTEFPRFLWGTLLTGIIVSSFCLFVPLSYYLKNPNRSVFLPSLVLVFIFPLFMNLPEGIWEVFGTLTGDAVKQIFDTFFKGYADVSFTQYRSLSLRHPIHNILIGKGCGGIDGQFLFILTFTVFLTLYGNAVSTLQTLFLTLAGIVMMFFANVLRIVSLFWGGVFLRETLGYDKGTQIFRFVAHTHLGWVMYGFALLVFFSMAFLMVRKAWTRYLSVPLSSATS